MSLLSANDKANHTTPEDVTRVAASIAEGYGYNWLAMPPSARARWLALARRVIEMLRS